MRPDDLGAVHALSRRAHLDYPERQEIFAEKLTLFPTGCFTLAADDDRVVGYCFSHPWTRGLPPALDTFLDALPAQPTTCFIHDVAIDPAWRGQGLVTTLMTLLADAGRGCGLRHQTLVAVHGTEAFWKQFGFTETADTALRAAVRTKYGPRATLMARSPG